MRIIFEYYFNEVKKEFIPTCNSEFKGDYTPLISYLNDDLGDKREYKEFLKNVLNILINNIKKLVKFILNRYTYKDKMNFSEEDYPWVISNKFYKLAGQSF